MSEERWNELKSAMLAKYPALTTPEQIIARDGITWADAELSRLRNEIKDLNEVIVDKRRLARELDVAMNGDEGAAKQPALCDLIGSAKRLRLLASRWYLPDGTYETLPEEEVIRRRKEAAKKMKALEEELALWHPQRLYADMSHEEIDAMTKPPIVRAIEKEADYWEEVSDDSKITGAEIKAVFRSLRRRFLSGKVTG